MTTSTEYYVMKGMVSELAPELQEEVRQAEADVLAVAHRSDHAKVGALMAMMKIAEEA